LGRWLTRGGGLRIARCRGRLLLLLLFWLLRLLKSLWPYRLVDNAWCDVQTVVDVLRDWLDLSSQLLFNPVEIETVLVGDKVNGETQMPKASGSTNSVKIGLRVLGEIKVDDDIDSLNVDTTGE